jgi:hypothetical protein
MTNEQTELLRINLLRQLKASAPLSLTIDALRTGARLEGFDLGPDEHAQRKTVQIECEHLADATINFVRVADAKFSQAVKRYTITAPGREWLAEQGF